MNKLKSSLFTACAAFLFLAGCAEPYRNETVDQICPAGLDKQQAMQITEDVLAKMNFTIAKSDANLGVIKTRPLTGAQFFEFWRKDNVGVFNSAEANLHSIRRTAELNIQQQGTQLCIHCSVNTQRLHLPEREIRSRARAYEMFSQSGPTRPTLKLNPRQKEGMAWVDLGNDPKLATVILKQIEGKITKTQKGKTL
ncbi:MAG: hypothetical protein WAK60_06610 [Sedimentisphaerales bacterium]